MSDWRPGPLPYRRALDLLITDLWPGGEVVSTSRMRGGIGTLMHAVNVVRRDERLRLVLRRFNRPQAGMNAELARREWDVLSRLHAIGLPVPQPLWVDTESGWFGVPALLLRRLRGRPDLDPQDLDAWARGIAGALAEIHAVEIGPFIDVLPDETREDRQLRYLASELSDDVVAAAPFDARRLVEAVFDRHATVETTRRLTHGDFHAGNVLWADGVVSGVVDWSTTRIGDPLFDLAYLRLDSTVVYGAAAGEAVVGAYEDASGRTVDDLEAWDLLAATTALPDPGPWAAGPTDLGRTDLDVDTVVDRYREHVARLLSG